MATPQPLHLVLLEHVREAAIQKGWRVFYAQQFSKLSGSQDAILEALMELVRGQVLVAEAQIRCAGEAHTIWAGPLKDVKANRTRRCDECDEETRSDDPNDVVVRFSVSDRAAQEWGTQKKSPVDHPN